MSNNTHPLLLRRSPAIAKAREAPNDRKDGWAKAQREAILFRRELEAAQKGPIVTWMRTRWPPRDFMFPY
jgi:hypothetical protein